MRLFFLLFLSLLSLLYAQEERWVPSAEGKKPISVGRIDGRVIDARTGEPLPGVTLRLGSIGLLTSEKGTFSLPYEKPDTLELFLLGYRPLRVFLARPRQGVRLSAHTRRNRARSHPYCRKCR